MKLRMPNAVAAAVLTGALALLSPASAQTSFTEEQRRDIGTIVKP